MLKLKLKEALLSVLPVTIIILILYFTPLLTLSLKELLVFLVSALFLILGIAFFSLGAELSMSPMGEKIGSGLIKSKKVKIILLVCFVMGVLITVAEPDLTVLSKLVKDVINPTLLIILVGVGVGLFLVIAVLKIIFKNDLSTRLLFSYLLMFMLSALALNASNGAFLPLAYDSGGVTTGPITVPFIMALGLGIAQTIGGRESRENSFGLVALCSIGPILVVLLLSLTIKGNINYQAPDYSLPSNLGYSILTTILHSIKEVGIALGLIVIFFLIINKFFINLPKRKLMLLGVGILYTLLGLVLFLSAASIGFMPIGYKIGNMLAHHNAIWIIAIGFILGVVVVLAEPAVMVLTKQVESVTTGGVSKKSMLLALCIGVGISIALSMIRIYFGFSILYYVIPGYFISLGLSFFVPKVYTAIAFDSGGVASGPLTSSFILPMAIGATMALKGESYILELAFGIVGMVAMTPLITIQMLGFKSVITKRAITRSRMKIMKSRDDEQIIEF
ncbi:MAG: DUF1538 domain-containing protein [Anaeroplasmataceae bacterium]